MDAHGYRPAPRVACSIADLTADGGRSRNKAWVNLHVFQPKERSGPQEDLTDNAVPIALGMVRDAMRIPADINDQPVIHPDGQGVLPRSQRAEIILVRSGEAEIGADAAVINPDARFPVRPFQEEDDPLF